MKRIVIFSGTTEGRQLSALLSGQKIDHFVCVATQYGSDIMNKDPYALIRTGRMDAGQMTLFLNENGFTTGDFIVDATHPYAAEAGRNIREAADTVGCEYIRVLRSLGEPDLQEGEIHYHKSPGECIKWLNDHFSLTVNADNTANAKAGDIYPRILLTTGAKELHEYCTHINKELLSSTLVRVLPSHESIEACISEGISRSNIIAMQGPFSYELNKAIMSQYNISQLITKSSGRNGGYEEKVRAALDLGITVHVLERPVREEGLSIREAYDHIISTNQNSSPSLPSNAPRTILLCGCGAGSPLQMTEAVRTSIIKADAIFGSGRMLECADSVIKQAGGNTAVPDSSGILRGDIHRCVRLYDKYLARDIIPVLEGNKDLQTIVVLFSGDSGFYSGARAAMQDFSEWDKDAQIRILPGISSVSYLAARLGESYDDAMLFSLHGRNGTQSLKELIDIIRCSRKTFVLLSGTEDINLLGNEIVNKELDCRIYAGCNLSYDDERIDALTPQEAAVYRSTGILTALIINNSPAAGENTAHSSRFFVNKKCEFYPCHKGLDELNCLFCYCPLYDRRSCPGTFSMKEKNGRVVKSCIDCIFPHEPGNYDIIISMIKKSPNATPSKESKDSHENP